MHSEHAHPLKAALWMCGAIASFTLMAVAGRTVQVELSSFELMFWRSLFGFAIVAGLIRWRKRNWDVVRTRVPALHLIRNLFHFFGQNMWFYGITVIPLSQLVALEFTLPIWVLLLAPLLLGETLTRRKIVVALVGFAGVLLVAQPGVQRLNAGHAAGILAAIGFAVNLIFTRKIMRHDTVLCVLFWMTLSQAAMGLILSLVTIMSVLSVPMMVIAGNPTMMTAMMAHRVTYYGDYAVANALGLFSYLITAVAAYVYLRMTLSQHNEGAR